MISGWWALLAPVLFFLGFVRGVRKGMRWEQEMGCKAIERAPIGELQKLMITSEWLTVRKEAGL